MKLASPHIASQLAIGSFELLMEGELEAASLNSIDATKCNVLGLDVDGVRIEKTSFLQAQLSRLAARDFFAKQSDFSSATVSDGNINRAEFVTCRMTGVDLNKTLLHDVVFRGCKLDLANFRFTDLRRVRFIDCTLIEADFLNAALHDVAFESCVLDKTVFERATCKQVDLRTSQLVELTGWSSLKGAMVDEVQLMEIAPYLARELGILVR